ncbi:trypsin-like serine protease [Thermomonospora cellulosilytica]|uniref:Secreted trypsin-like serine protease n=1 Tax=Thermomonospora cellulosilytica TaxID=1411118 RepID=A0A7W3MYF4_9ACTN|nr:trypsin-like serine protease [Thermomonospora cellulosilytica]MBA9004190.1 secreted trypsin-like serine protease [Thermomonospora cellulosilytica]
MGRPVVLAALTAAAAAAVTVGIAGPASAINSYNAEPAPERTEVGALVVQYDRDGDPGTPDVVRWTCSGTMISADVFLTAAHCTVGRPAGTRFYVSLAQDVQGAIDASNALGGTPEQIAARVGVEGTAHSDPAYPGTQSDSHDIAVITFDRRQSAELARRWSFTPATLPGRGQLSALGSRALDDRPWLVVGYGTQEAVNGPGGHTHPGGGVRMKATLDFNAINPTWVRLAMNESRELGGACYGDSGGPNFVELDGRLVLAGTTITGDVPCKATNVTYRTDSDSARTFLGRFVTLP